MISSFGQRCITAMWVFVSHAANSMKHAFHYASCGLRFLICVVATAWFLLHGGIAHAYGGWYPSTSAAQAACQVDLATFLPTRPSSYCTGVTGSLDAQCAPPPKGPNYYVVLNVCVDDWHFCGGGWHYKSCGIGVQCPTGQTYNYETQQCQPEKDSDDKCDTSVSNPCNAATGNKHQEEKDYLASTGLPSLTRYYNSLLRRHFTFGTNWTSVFQRSLEIQGNNASNHLIQIRQESGRGEPFRCTNYICSGDADTALTLTQDTTGYTLKLRGGGGATERYDTTGKLLSETSPTGQATAYSYDTNGRLTTVSSAFGHTLTFGYNTSGHVATVTDPTGQVISYSYDTNNLTRVDYPDATAKLYHYENTSFPNHLTGISHVDAGGVTTRYSTYAYDTNGKATLTQHAQTDNGAPQEKFSLAYDFPAANQTTVTDPVGVNEVMTFATNLGVKNLVTKTSSIDTSSLQQTFDANNNLTCRKDEENRVTLYGYNSTNQKLSQTEGLTGDCTNPANVPGVTRTTTYEYLSPTLDLPRFVRHPSVAAGQTFETELAYGDTGHPNLPTQIIQRGYTPSGTAISRTVGLGYNGYGQVNVINGPRTDVTDITTLEYNECTTGGGCGQLKKVTNALGQFTTYDLYDANGRLLQITDPNGLKTRYTHDPRGRVKTVTQTRTPGGSATWKYSYTPWGDVSQVIDPDGVTLTYGYDAAHYLRTITAADGYLYYAYDLKGNRMEEDVYNTAGGNTRWTSYAYDLRNHLTTITTAGNITQFVHDAVGNLTAQTDGNNHNTTHSYDALNRLFKTVDALSGETGYGYDVADKVRQISAPLSPTTNLVTQYQYDDLGNLLQEVSPDRGTLTYTYDAAGNVLTVTNGRGDITTYTYDALNRVVYQESTDTNSPWFNYFYDSCKRGRLCTIQKNDAFDMSFSYDYLGRLSYRLDASWFYTGYAYTPGGRLSRVSYSTYPSRTVDYTYDIPGGTGRVTKVTTTSNGTTTVLAQGLGHAPFGPLTHLTYGNGLFRSTWLDEAYRLTLRYDAVFTESSLGYDGADNLTGLSSSTLGQLSYGYDPLNRLTTASATVTRPRGSTTDTWGYAYDSNGNRQNETRNGVATAYAYYPDSNRLFHAGNDWRLMDAAGNTRLGTAFGWLVHDGYGRMVSALNGAASYDYNAFDQRIKKTAGGLTTSFHYGPQGELLYESDGTNTKAYVYLERVPLARIDNNSQVYYYHTDRLGTPQAMTNSMGNVVWKATYDPFGQATVTTGTITNNLRLAGQYYDAETGLHYNWHRYYDPKIGRYISSDPIGLAGGLNTYTYVANNPLRWVDPKGLFNEFPGDTEQYLNPCSFSGSCNSNVITERIKAEGRAAGKCLGCIAKCEAKVLLGAGVEHIAEKQAEKKIKEIADRLAKEYALRGLKFFGWVGVAQTGWDAAQCLIECK